MRTKLTFFLFAFCLSFKAFGLAVDDHQTIKVSLSSSKPSEGLARVLRAATKMGGYFQEATGTRAHLRLPKRMALKLSKELNRLGDVTAYDIEGQNYSPTKRQLETKLMSKEKMLKSYIKLIQQASKPSEIIQAENAAAAIIGEIERYKGQLAVIRDKLAYSDLIVNFSPVNETKQTISKNVVSNFSWMNQSGLIHTLQQELIEEEEYGVDEEMLAH